MANKAPGKQAIFWLGLTWACLAACYQHLPSPDLWWLLADGRWMVEHGSIPLHDPFSWSAAGAPWHNDQWLTALLAYWLYSWGGLSLLHLAKALILTLTLLLLLDTGRRLQAPSYPLGLCLALGLTWLCGEGRFFFDVRAYLFSYLGLALLWRWLQLESRLDLRKLAVLFALWANLHGGVSSGLLLLGLELVFGNRRRELARALALATACCCLNPSGIWLLLHPLVLLGSDWKHYLNEWTPAWKRPGYFSWHFLHLGLWGAGLLWQRRRLDRHDLVVTAFGLFSLTGWRHIPLFALLAIPRWCRLLNFEASQAATAVVWLSLVLAANLRPLHLGDPGQSLENEMFPRQACEFLRAHPQANERLYHPYGLGGYLLWSLPPEQYRVCIDGRAVQVYPFECYRDYLAVALPREDGPRKFAEYCRRNGVNTVMLFNNGRREAGAHLLAGLPNWTVIYADELVVLATTDPSRWSPRS